PSTLVMTTYLSLSAAMVSARLSGSSWSSGSGRPWPPSQNGPRRVPLSPLITPVAAAPPTPPPGLGPGAPSAAVRSVCSGRPALAHVTARAAARALVADDHEGGRAPAEALADVGARRLLAHGVQLVLAQDGLDFVEARARAARPDADPVGFLEHLALLDLDGN